MPERHGATVAKAPAVTRALHGAHNLVEAAAESRPLVKAYEVLHHGHQLFHAAHGAHDSNESAQGAENHHAVESATHRSSNASTFALKGLAAMQSLARPEHGPFLDSKF